MAFVIALAQCGYPQGGDTVAQIASWCAEAARRGAQLLVFPEDLMSPTRLEPSQLCEIAQPLDGPFVGDVCENARRYGLWIVFTTYEANGEDAPYNTAVVVDDSGRVRATYRKCHLYNAHGVFESDRNAAGTSLFSPIDTPFGELGLAICYDLRFPEVARQAALAGCELLVYPSAWHDGPEKLSHWRTLLRARAIENELYVVGAGKAGERYVGHSLVADPLGRVLCEASGKNEELVTCEVDLAAVASARDAMPVLTHRRPELYS